MVKDIYIDRVMYTDKVNVDNKDEAKSVIREIQTVYDYLRAIMAVLSNYYITKYPGFAIKKYEDLFALDNSILKDKLNEGVFFRGQGKNYDYIIPGLYRTADWYINEDQLKKRIEIMDPAAFSKAKNSFERLAVMQHYGLRTRILDITTNALVALYFAVSRDKEDDGVVYLFKGDLKEKGLRSDSEKVLAKMAVSDLNYEQKRDLSLLLAEYSQSHIEIREIAEKEGNGKYMPVVDAVYAFFQHDTGNYFRKIYADELFGMDLVLPNRLDDRLVNQEGAFFLFGLENVREANAIADEKIRNNCEIAKMEEELNSWESRQRVLCEDDTMDEEESEKCAKKIGELYAEIDKSKEKLQKQLFIESIQENINAQVRSAEFIYAPESELNYIDDMGCRIMEGNARIKILKEHKGQILSELKMLGINEGIVYPDLSHKAFAVNDWYA